MSSKRQDFVLGLVVLGFVALLFATVVFIYPSLGVRTRPIVVHFEHDEGVAPLKTGGPVLLSGALTVGKITRVSRYTADAADSSDGKSHLMIAVEAQVESDLTLYKDCQITTDQPPVVREALSGGPLEYAPLWKTAQKLTANPLKFGTICSQSVARMVWNEYYPTEKELILDLCDIMNQELRNLADSGCDLIQIEEPRHHFMGLNPATKDEDYAFYTEAFNREIRGVNAEIWLHTCWGNPAQQRLVTNPSYERSIAHLLEVDADVITFECASTGGKDLSLLAGHETSKKVAIGVVSHTNTVVESPDSVADLIRRALEYVPPERLIISSDCGFGREGISRRIAFHKCVSLVQGTNIVRRELGLPEATVRAADPRFAFGESPGA